MANNSSFGHEGHEVHGSPYAILFIFAMCTTGGKQTCILVFRRVFLDYFSAMRISEAVCLTFSEAGLSHAVTFSSCFQPLYAR